MQFIPLFYFGAIACDYKLTEKSILYNDFIMSIVLLVFVVCSLCYCQIGIPAMDKFFKVVASFAVSLLVLYTMQRHCIGNNVIVSVLKYLGVNSIVIYLTHISIIRIMPTSFIANGQFLPFWTLVISLLLSSIIVIFCLAIGKVTEMFVWFDRFVFGRNWKGII